MDTKVAILGTGVLARQLIRTIFDSYSAETVLIADISGQYASNSQMADDLAYHVLYDTLYKRWKGHNVISSNNGKLVIDGKEIPCIVDSDVSNLPLGELGVDVFIDCSGVSDNGAVINGAWNAGAKCCIATTRPSSNALTDYYNNNTIVTPLNDVAHGYSAYLCDGNVVARSIITKIVDNNQIVNVAHYTVHKPNTNYMYVQDYPDGHANRNSRACDNTIYEGTISNDLVRRIMAQLNGKCYTSTYRIVNKTMHSTLCDFEVKYSDTIEHVIGNIKGYDGDGYKYILYDSQDTVSSDYENQDVIGINDNCISMQQNGSRVQVNVYYDAILLQVRNIIDYLSSHNNDWTTGH